MCCLIVIILVRIVCLGKFVGLMVGFELNCWCLDFLCGGLFYVLIMGRLLELVILVVVWFIVDIRLVWVLV